MLQIENHGPLVVATNYWESEYERAGKLFGSCNAGAIRLLLPRAMRSVLNDLRRSEYVILSRGPWPEAGRAEAVEILWEDHSDDPQAWRLSAESFDTLPAEPRAGREWIISVWDLKKGKPHKAIERRCYWRRVALLPCLKPWKR